MTVSFEKICKIFLIEEPFYGIVLASLRKEENYKIPTLGVAQDGNTFMLAYNPKFLAPLSNDTVVQLLKHEMEHICFDHCFMGKETGYENEDPRLFNIACDLECNSYLDRSRMDKEAGGCWAEDYGWQPSQGSRAYYNMLKAKQQQQQMPNQNPNKPCNGGQGGQQTQEQQEPQQSEDGDGDGDSNDSNQQGQQQPQSNGACSKGKPSHDDPSMTGTHDLWPDVSKEQMERMVRQIESVLVDAADEVEKGYGTERIPDALRMKIQKLRKKPKPVADWRRYCRRFMSNEYSYLTKKSRRRESKRFEGMAGTKHQRMSHILIGIDTSGSVSMPEYMEFMGQMRTMKGVVTFDVIECDNEIRHRYTFNGQIPEQLHGGGGTDFQPVIDVFNSTNRYDCLVYFTDGECNIPYDTPKDTLWVISSRGRKNNDYTRNGAKVLFIPPKQN